MKLALFSPRAARGGAPSLGVVLDDRVVDAGAAWARRGRAGPFARDLLELLASTEFREFCLGLEGAEPGSPSAGAASVACLRREEVAFRAPVARPGTFRDFYSFEEHVRRARARRGLDVPAEWHRRPVFYFSNPNSILGPEDEVAGPASTRKLDFEMEIACVIGRAGRDVSPESAAEMIAGYALLNDWSARDLQAEEMAVGLGPSKGKDFATSLGPWLVTPDELAPRRDGKGHDLVVEARRNGQVLGPSNWNRIAWSFEEMIAHAARDAWLYPGDLIGSGTLGGGCILEIGEEAAGGWLRPGEVIELDGGPLGTLRNRIRAAGGPPA